MEGNVKIKLLLPSLVLGASLIGSTFVAANAIYQVKALSKGISVTGSVDRTVRSDTVKWRGTFSRRVAVDGLAEGNRLIKQDLKETQNYLKDHRVADAQVTINPVSITPTCGGQQQYYYDGKSCGPNPVVGYTLTQSIIVESDDVDGITLAAQLATNYLLEKGIIFSSDPLEYYYGKLADLRLDMLSEATKNAKARAEQIVASTGGRLGPVQSASMGVFQVTAVNSMEVSDYGAYDTSTVEKKVTAVVRATFALE